MRKGKKSFGFPNFGNVMTILQRCINGCPRNHPCHLLFRPGYHLSNTDLAPRRNRLVKVISDKDILLVCAVGRQHRLYIYWGAYIYVTGRLGIWWLWVDSLCIIQNSVDDWAPRSSVHNWHIWEYFLSFAALGDGVIATQLRFEWRSRISRCP